MAASLLSLVPVKQYWMCDDGLILVVVSPKCKAVAPTCGQAFSWEFYSGTASHFFPLPSCVAAEWWLCCADDLTC